MDRSEYMGIFGLSVHEKIAERWNQLETDTQKQALVNLSRTILPAYHAALSDGYKYYGLSDKSRDIVFRIMETTGIKDGQSIVNYLYFLNELGQKGIIEMKHVNPETPRAPGIVDTVTGKTVESNISSGIEAGFNKLLITGGIVAGVVLISREIIKNIMK